MGDHQRAGVMAAVQQRVMTLAQQGAIPPDKVLMMLQNNINPLRPQKPHRQ